jgi:nicotinate-nucleotide pyrophosphorylase (carboxylating)
MPGTRGDHRVLARDQGRCCPFAPAGTPTRPGEHSGRKEPAASDEGKIQLTLETPNLRPIVTRCLEEDLGRGDVTTDACVPADATARLTMGAREPLVFCGAAVVEEVFRQLDPEVTIERLCEEGALLARGARAMGLEGSTRSILKGERLALNFAQRLSAVASLTRRCVDALAPGSRTRITDTRKTTPGMRTLERYAVRCGGGHNHRADLGAAVLIKDNHVAAAGGVKNAITRAREAASHTGRITCEVDTFDQLSEALDSGADIIMLDNFPDDSLEHALEVVAGRALVEVSGGITIDRIAKISQAGVDIISVGALTHSAGSVDLGLDWEA